MKRVALVTALIALEWIVPPAHGCSQSPGYFHQVTRLRGTVVGVNQGDWRHPIRWFRHHATVGEAKLSLHAYVSNRPTPETRPAIKVARSNKHGVFDFGILPKGHYTLTIDAPRGEATWFDVEIEELPKPVDIVLIDVSPVYPDCTGGREFLPVAR